jgi:hypothetical protein
MNWKEKFQQEIEGAERARQAGNEGMARVCARRAVGAVVEEYFSRHGIAGSGHSAYDRIRQLIADPGTGDEIREIAGHFLVRITPDQQLPIQADLIKEARWLADYLIRDNG